jgi:glycosyltransferase involved in cell wall biosynthesis
LRQLYRDARLFVFPSVHEGFGLPVVEAMACRCPVLFAATSAVVEVAGGHGHPFAIFEPDDFTTQLRAALATAPSEATLDAARDHVRTRYTWQHAARGCIDVYRAALAREPRPKLAGPRPRTAAR